MYIQSFVISNLFILIMIVFSNHSSVFFMNEIVTSIIAEITLLNPLSARILTVFWTPESED